MTEHQPAPRILALGPDIRHSLATGRGQSLLARVRVATADGRLVRPGPAVTVRLLGWGPREGTQPLAQASEPDVIAEAEFDGRDWCAVLSTAGWPPGRWLLRAEVRAPREAEGGAEPPAGDRMLRGRDEVTVDVGERPA